MDYKPVYEDTKDVKDLPQLASWGRFQKLPLPFKSKSIGWFIAGAALGAISMYLLDPQKGRTRRIHIRDKFVKWSNQFQHFREKKMKHMRNQFMGWDANVNHFQGAKPVGSKTKREDHFN